MGRIKSGCQLLTEQAQLLKQNCKLHMIMHKKINQLENHSNMANQVDKYEIKKELQNFFKTLF
jgi:hypothetical protein